MSDSSFHDAFEVDAARYDAFIDWDARLANETPFYKRLFEQVGVKRVLDVACGTGRHAALFHSWGLHVEGADVSDAMIAHCRKHYTESDTLRWVQRSFDVPPDAPGSFDAVVCVGNSLSLADNVPAVVAAMLAALRPGGVCVAQVLNIWRIPEGPTQWKKHARVTIAGRDRIILKGVHRVGSRAYIDLVDLALDGDEVAAHFDTPSFNGIESADLLAAATQAGAVDPQLYGTFQPDPYDRAQSADLTLVCRRGA